MLQPQARLHCSFSVVQVDRDRLFLVDEDQYGKRSVTNDAEAVIEWCQKKYPGRRAIYRDSMGRWDEITLNAFNAVQFLPYCEYLPESVSESL